MAPVVSTNGMKAPARGDWIDGAALAVENPFDIFAGDVVRGFANGRSSIL